MAVGLYTDVHISRALISALRRRGVDVLSSVEDDTRRFQDTKLLDRATELGRILYTQDDDLAVRRIRAGVHFSGVIYSHQLRSPVGKCVQDLEIIAKTIEPEDLAGILEFIPY
jgi:predicted nuclease of predicted toxin-antitoxin system